MNQNVFIRHMVVRHFKGGLYCTLYSSKPASPEKIVAFDESTTDVLLVRDSEFDQENVNVTATSTLEEQGLVMLYLTEEGVFHCSSSHNNELAIYVSLYDGVTYGRPMDMFLSLTDKEKYPDATQEYRMQYLSSSIKGIRTNTIFDIENERVTAFFGDGKLRVGYGYQDTPEGRVSLLSVLEDEECSEIGSSRKANTRRDYEPDMVLAFKNKESIDVMIDTLNKCKLTLDNAL